jgi:hypothetical protein
VDDASRSHESEKKEIPVTVTGVHSLPCPAALAACSGPAAVTWPGACCPRPGRPGQGLPSQPLNSVSAQTVAGLWNLIMQEFNYSEHSEIYNWADHAVEAPIAMVDACIFPPDITSYKY